MGIIFSSFNGLEAYPKLRFLEFKNAYKKIKLNEAVERIQRKDPTSEAPIMMLSAASGFIMQSEKYSRENAGQSLKKYILLRKGELAYNHGASKYKPFGCCFELKEDEARIPYVYHCFAVKENNDKSYIARLLNNQKIDQQLKRLISSSVRMDGLLNISYEEYTGIDLYLPSLLEQQKIADFLFLVDRRIEKQRQLVESLKKYKRGLLSAIFDRKLRFKDENGNDYPEWEYKKISDVFKLTRGYVLAAAETSELQTSEFKYPVYSSQTKNEGLLGYYNKFLYKNAITWTTDGANAGYVKFRKGEFYCTNVCGVLLCDKGNGNTYIAEKLNSVTKRYVSYVGNPKLMNNVMAEIYIDFPSIQEQETISKLLTRIDERIKTANFLYERIISLKQGLLQQLFI